MSSEKLRIFHMWFLPPRCFLETVLRDANGQNKKNLYEAEFPWWEILDNMTHGRIAYTRTSQNLYNTHRRYNPASEKEHMDDTAFQTYLTSFISVHTIESSSIFIFKTQEQFSVINLILPKSSSAAKSKHIPALWFLVLTPLCWSNRVFIFFHPSYLCII